MMVKKDIRTMDDIRLLVNSFYTKIKVDPVVGAIFIGVIKDQWDKHLEKMYRFWQTVLLDDHTYFGSPFPPHAQMPLEQKHFDAWLKLWHETLDEYFEGSKAEEAKWRGDKMAVMFLSKIEYYRDQRERPLL